MFNDHILSLVLKKDVHFLELADNTVVYEIRDNEKEVIDRINKFELVYECKRWALDNGFMILSGFCKDYTGKAEIRNTNDHYLLTEYAETECLAVVKACKQLDTEIKHYWKQV